MPEIYTANKENIEKGHTHNPLSSFCYRPDKVKFETQDKIILGELALDGKLRAVRGVLPVALCAKEHGFKEIILGPTTPR